MKANNTIISLAIMVALTACGDNKTAEDYIAQAEKFQAENKLKESEIALKNAIKLAPSDAQSRFNLGALYLQQGEAAGAVKELEKAKSLKFKGRDLIPLLARAYIIAEDNEGVIELNSATNALPEDQQVQLLAYQVLAYVKLEQPEQARASAEQANKLLPASPYTVLANAYIATLDADYDLASMLIKKSLQLLANNPEALMLQGQVAAQQNDFAAAAVSFEQYLAVQPKSKLIYLLLADTLVKTDDYLKAEKYADTILAAVAQQPVANYVKAVVRFAEKDYEQALKFAEVGLNSSYKTPHLRLVAGASAFYLAKYEQANLHLGTIINQLTPEHSARKMYAVSQFHIGAIDNVTDALQEYIPVSEEDEKFMSSLSFSLYSLGATEEAKKIAKRIAQSNLDSADASGRKGILKLLMEDRSGVDDLKMALEKNPDLIGAELALAYVALDEKKYDEAIAIATKWQEKYPNKADGHNMLAAIYMRQDDLEKAVNALNQSLATEPNNAFALNELTAIYNRQGRTADAKEMAQKAIQYHPNNLKTLYNNYALNRDAKALQAIKVAFDESEDKNQYAALYMQALLDSDQLPEMLNVAERLTYDFKTPKKVWQLILVAHYKQQKGAKIKATLENWIEANPYHSEPVFLLADYYVKGKDAERALSVINKALNGEHANNLQLKLVKMQLLLDNRKVSDAKRLLAELDETTIQDGIVAGIKGRIALLENRITDAIAGLKAFYDAYPSSQNAVLLAVAYNRSGDMNKAISGLEAHLVKNENDLQARNLLANYYVQKDTTKAVLEYEKLVESQPLNIVALNNLAWLALESNDVDKAMTYAKKAYELAPKVPNVADTYAKVLLRTGNKLEALKKSSEAYELSNGKDIDISINFVETLVANNQKDKAINVLQTLELKTEDNQKRVNEILKQLNN